jgi:hypothetical protein
MEEANNQIELPKSTRSKVIVPIKTDLYMFDHKNAYEDNYLRHILPKSEFDQIFVQATRVMGGSWSKKRNNDIIKIPNFIIGLAGLSLLLTILYMIFIFLSAGSTTGSAYLTLSIICVTSATGISFGLSIYNFTRKLGRFKSLQDMINEDIEKYFNELNFKYEGRLSFKYLIDYAEVNVLKPGGKGDDHHDGEGDKSKEYAKKK